MVLTWLIKGAFYNFFLSYIKMSDCADLTYQKNRDVILNRTKFCMKMIRKDWGGQARDKYKNLSEDEKNKKRVDGKNRYHNISEEKKQRLKEYHKNYRKAKRSQYNNE